MNQRLKVIEEWLIHYADKYQLLKRGIYVGIGINGILYYKQFLKLTALKRIQGYMDEKVDEFDNRIISQQTSLMEALK